jgi:hypothetical protein
MTIDLLNGEGIEVEAALDSSSLIRWSATYLNVPSTGEKIARAVTALTASTDRNYIVPDLPVS